MATEDVPTAENAAWPGTDAHRYAYCLFCASVIRDFNQDAVWRDRDGYTSCSHEVPNGPEDLHRPCVIPPGKGDDGASVHS